jgi:hypothetical protein
VAIEIDWKVLQDWAPALQNIISAGHLDMFTSYAAVSEQVAAHALETYRGYLLGQPLPNGAAVQHPSGVVAKGAELAEKGFLDYYLENPVPHAESLEKGVQQRDMKDCLPTAKKARRAKDGSLYLIIPFRHGAPGSVGMAPMPARIHAMAQALSRSKVTGHRQETSGTGFDVTRNTYKWGGKITTSQIQDAGGTFKSQNRFSGMYKFGNARHTSYVTFRVMSSKSPGWIIPARPGIWAARTAVQVATQDGQGLLNEALAEDLLRISTGG